MQEQPEHPTQPAKPSRHIRTVIPAELHGRLAHLAIDLDTTMSALMIEGLLLLVRYHDRGDGLEEPTAPLETVAT